MLPIARWTFRRRLRHPRLSAFACGRTRGRRQGGTALAVTRRYRRPRSRTWALPSVSRAGGRSSPACRRTFSRKCWQKPLADGWPDHRRACRKAEAGVASGASAGAGGGRFIEGLGNEMSADDTRTRFSVRISYSDDSDGVSELLQASYSSLFRTCLLHRRALPGPCQRSPVQTPGCWNPAHSSSRKPTTGRSSDAVAGRSIIPAPRMWPAQASSATLPPTPIGCDVASAAPSCRKR